MSLGATTTVFAPLNTMIDSDRNYAGPLGALSDYDQRIAGCFGPRDGLSTCQCPLTNCVQGGIAGLGSCGCGGNPARYGLSGLDGAFTDTARYLSYGLAAGGAAWLVAVWIGLVRR